MSARVGSGRLDGKVAVITGAASGIGAGTARSFVAEGARVVLADVHDDAGQELAAELGSGCVYARTDVTQEPDVAAVIDLAVEHFGRLDIMFNNAGVVGAVGSIAELRLADIELTLGVNLRGPLLGMKHAARAMRPQQSGVILSTSSPAGTLGGLGAHAYSATKAGVIGLTQSIAAELRRHGIRANTVVPGATVTGMTAELTRGDRADLAGATEHMAAGALMERPVLPADVAAAAVYLASDDAAFVTGCTLPVDAGMTWAGGSSPYATGEYEHPGVLGARSGA